MSPRTARTISGILVALAILMTVTTIVVGITTFSRQRPGEIVVVPAERGTDIRQAAAELDHQRDCAGDVEVDPELGDAPSVYCQLEIHRATGSTFEAGWGDLALFLLAIAWLGTGVLIVSRQPRNASGWIFTTIGFVFFLEVFSVMLLVKGAKVDPGSVPLTGLWVMVAEYAFFPFALVSLLFLLYPDGRPPTPKWRWAVRALLLGAGISMAAFALDAGPMNNLVDRGIIYLNPIAVPALGTWADVLTGVGALIAVWASFSTVFAVRGRFKRSSGEERQQMRWLVFVATLAGAALVLLFVGGFTVDALISNAEEGIRVLGFDPFDVLWGIFALTLVVGIPAAYLVAIFKHGLWELDVVIKKALVAVVLTLVLVGLGLVVIVTLGQSAFWTGTRRPVAILMGVIAGLLIWPLFRLSRRIARRIVFGRRADPYAVLSEFSGRVGETYATEDVLPRMAQILGQATGAASARVWLNIGGSLVPEAAWPAETPGRDPLPFRGDELPSVEGEDAAEVRDRGELLGALSVSMPARDPMNPAKERLVRDLASQAGLVLRNVKLIEELRASRQRLVAAQDEERRKLERNIHDGAQQQLVALQVKLRLAEQLADRDVEKAKGLLAELRAETGDALEDLRDLARGIYPPLLADQGLAAALEAQARKVPVPVNVASDGIGRYRQDVEAAVYFCTLEALNNVTKYAEASRVELRLLQEGGVLVFEVHDDGIGFDPDSVGHGSGLQGMADRLEAIGGALEVDAAAGSGTTIRGRVPTGSSS